MIAFEPERHTSVQPSPDPVPPPNEPPRITAPTDEPPTHALWVKHTDSLYAYRRLDGSFTKCLDEAHNLNLPTVDFWRIIRLSDGWAMAERHTDNLSALLWQVHRTQELQEQWQNDALRDVHADMERSLTDASFNDIYDQMMTGDDSGFPKLLAGLNAAATRDAAASTIAELLYREALTNEQARAVDEAVKGWTRETWRSSWDTRYLSDELDKVYWKRQEELDNPPEPDPLDRADYEYEKWRDER